MSDNKITDKMVNDLLPKNTNAKIYDQDHLDADLKKLVADLKEKNGNSIENFLIVDARDVAPGALKNKVPNYREYLDLPNVNIIKPKDSQAGFAPLGIAYVTSEDSTTTPTISDKPIDANKSGRMWGDPHFVGFEGEHYDISGDTGHMYNLIEDSGIAVNGKFSHGGRAVTVMTEIGFKVGSDEIGYQVNGAPTINGKPMTKGQSEDLMNGKVSWDGEHLRVETSEYSMMVQTRDHRYLNFDVSTKDKGVFSDGIMPSGLLGQTADGDGKTRPSKGGHNGAGVIEGTYKDYEVKDLFSTPKSSEEEESRVDLTEWMNKFKKAAG